MSEQQLTYEGILEMFQETDRRFKEAERRFKETERLMLERDARYEQMRMETDRQIKETNKKISALGTRIGEIVENMIGGRIIDKFRALGYEIEDYTRNHSFRLSKLGIKGEIDLILHDGDIAILIEVKTSLEIADVKQHLERMEKYRRFADIRKDPTRFIGAVAGAVVKDDVADFAHENGLYTIIQSGEAVEIVQVPENFQAKIW